MLNISEIMNDINNKNRRNNVLIETNSLVFEQSEYVEKCGGS